MITFEEAVKELKITTTQLQKAAPSGDGTAMLVFPTAYPRQTFLDFILQHRDCKLKFDVLGCDETTMNIVFQDDSVHTFYPLADAAKIVVRQTTSELLKALWSTSPAPSDTEKEFASRLGQLSSWLDADEMTPSNPYTEFGQGARAALEVMAVYSNTPEESAKYLDEIKAKSFVSIHREINTDPDCCPLCGSRVINSTNDDWVEDKYYDDLECEDCGAKWTLTYKYVSKGAIANKDGTTIIPTNQEVSK